MFKGEYVIVTNIGNSVQPISRKICSLAVCDQICCEEHALHSHG